MNNFHNDLIDLIDSTIKNNNLTSLNFNKDEKIILK